MTSPEVPLLSRRAFVMPVKGIELSTFLPRCYSPSFRFSTVEAFHMSIRIK